MLKKTNPTKLPPAHTANIIEQKADKDLLIYDLRTNKMFQLNETSKIVYKSCGKLSSLSVFAACIQRPQL